MRKEGRSTDPERLAALAEGVDATAAEASMPSDKAMILGRLAELGHSWDAEGVATPKHGRDGTHELMEHMVCVCVRRFAAGDAALLGAWSSSQVTCTD